MKPQSWEQLKSLFDAARRRDPTERAAFLTDACGGDTKLRQEIEDLLDAYEAADEFLADPDNDDVVSDSAEAPADPSAPEHRRIGRYQLLERLGEGGFGTVYRAEQVEPIRRLVALKLIRAEVDSRHIVARFAAER
ncbi:MAG: hypothetical protein KDA33_13705, partial [Phycisphaerales bacterium]|nr:hypothetical protein [Phycisphaerales bacterium]